MQNKSIEYPQYRKYLNGKSYFKIISPTVFEEITHLGNTWTLHLFTAKILPDYNFIQDLTFDYKSYCEVIEYSEYEEVKKNC